MKKAILEILEISENDLPSGKMYFNIAEKTIRPVLEDTAGEVISFTEKVTDAVNKKAGIGLKAAAPDPEEIEEKLKGIIDLASSGDTWEDVREETARAAETYSSKCVDDTIRANGQRQYEAGISAKVVRTASSGACTWCGSVAGTYSYEEVKGTGDDVWRRHANCDCVIEYEPIKGNRQLVSSGSYRQASGSLPPEEREKRAEEQIRKSAGEGTNLSPQERERLAENQRISEKDIALPDGVKNITEEFLKAKDEKQSSVIYEEGLNIVKQSEEIKIAEWAADKFGGKIELLKDSGEGLSPDYRWDGRLWDLKTPTGGKNAIDQRIRHGVNQINNNPGGIIVDLSKNPMNAKEAERITLEMAAKRAKSEMNVIIKRDKGFSVYRIQNNGTTSLK